MTTFGGGAMRAALGLAALAGCALTVTPAGAAEAGASEGESKAVVATVTQTASGPDVKGFRAFCDSWMQKLRERETYNTAHIAWETREGQVSGEYVGYETDCKCAAREQPGKDPVGTITYREKKWRRRGATQAEALASEGTLIEQTDVTEIFRYAKGRWQY